MKPRHLCMVLLLVAAFSSSLSADTGRLAIAGRSGTIGLGGELIVNILPQVNGRFGATFFDLSLDGEISDVEYDFDLDLLTFPLTIDWYPFDAPFHISAGVILNETEVGLDTRSHASLDIGGTTYSATDLGELCGDVSFNHVAPYIGIGWGNAFGREKRWGLISDFGVAFIGSADVSLSATGPIASDPTFMANLAAEEKEIEDDMSHFKIYPVLSISLFFRF